MVITNIPRPTSQIIKQHLRLWDTSESGKKYPLQEKALNFLFTEACPLNEDMTHIILKVSTLNDFYSTNIYDTYSVAERILSIKDLNRRLDEGDQKLVNEIAKVSIKGKTINFYSFASKYCSHHRPALFPIYDYYVERMLLHYNKCNAFMEFRKPDLKIYKNFLSAIQSFQKAYKLENFSLRDIDIFLWQAGKEYFPKSYKKKPTLNKNSNNALSNSAEFNGYLIKKLETGTIELFNNNIKITPVLPELKRLAGLLNIDISNSNGNPYNTRQLGDIIINSINKL